LQNQNKSLTRGLQILKEILFSDKPLTAVTLCQKLDIDKSTMSRLITSLMKEGFIKYLGNSKEIVKADIMDIMTSKATQEVLIERTQDLLENIFTLTNECSYLAVIENDALIYLNQVDNSTRVIKMRNTIGAQAPLHCTALGKVLLAFGNYDIKEVNFTEYTRNTLKKARFLQKEIEGICEKGYAVESEEYEYGLSSVAVPVFNHDKELVGAIGIAGLSARLDEARLHEYAQGIQKINSKHIRL